MFLGQESLEYGNTEIMLRRLKPYNYLCCESTALRRVVLLRVTPVQSGPRICFHDPGNVEVNIADGYSYNRHTRKTGCQDI